MALLTLVWGARLEGLRRDPQIHLSVDYAAVVATGRMIDLGTFQHAYEWGDGPTDPEGAPYRTAAMKDMGLDGMPPPWVYPPVIAYLAWPWSRFDYATGLWLWRVCSTLFAIAGAFLWWQTWAPARRDPDDPDDPDDPNDPGPQQEAARRDAPRRLAIVMLLALAVEPLRYALILGQSTPLVFFLVAASMYLARRDLDVAAGITLALAAAIKLSPAIFGLVFLVQGRWRTAGTALAAGVALLAVSLVLAGAPIHAAYFANLQALSDGTIVAYNNASLEAFVGRFFIHESYGRTWDLVDPTPAAFALTMLARVAVTSLLGLAVWRARPQSSQVAHDVPASKVAAGHLAQVTVLWLLLVPSIAWTHYDLWILPVLLVLHDWTPPASRPVMRVPLLIAFALVCWPVIPAQHQLAHRMSYFVAGPTYAALISLWLVHLVSTLRTSKA